MAAAGDGAARVTGDGDRAAGGAASAGKVRVIKWAARARREAGPIGWGAFLASSWTWCIGMFLPVLMLRDYGAWGWFVFAVPNVIGAAAMGWVLRDRDASVAMQSAHLPACRWFSLVTVAFHAFFAIALVPRLIGDNFVTLAVVMVPLVAVLWGPQGRRATLAGALALAVSVLALLAILVLQGLPELPPPRAQRLDLLWLAPVSAFGFLLAPYLDLTFHRARQSSTRAGGRTAFGVGFGVFFLLMIIFTALYARPLMDALAGVRRYSIHADAFAAVLSVHLAIQTAFTVVAHTDALSRTAPIDPLSTPATESAPQSPAGAADPADTAQPPALSPNSSPARARAPWPRVVAGAVAIIALALGLRWLSLRFPIYHGLSGRRMNSSELVYLIFMAFYGLVFPAYVWLFMVPSLRKRRAVAARRPRTATIVFFAAVMILAAPSFWMGFVEGKMAWLVPGLALVMISRLLLPKGQPATATGP